MEEGHESREVEGKGQPQSKSDEALLRVQRNPVIVMQQVRMFFFVFSIRRVQF